MVQTMRKNPRMVSVEVRYSTKTGTATPSGIIGSVGPGHRQVSCHAAIIFLASPVVEFGGFWDDKVLGYGHRC
jgi:hypothetical protein